MNISYTYKNNQPVRCTYIADVPLYHNLHLQVSGVCASDKNTVQVLRHLLASYLASLSNYELKTLEFMVGVETQERGI